MANRKMTVEAAYEEIAKLRQALMEVRATANTELRFPTGLSDTCLSLIVKAATKALDD